MSYEAATSDNGRQAGPPRGRRWFVPHLVPRDTSPVISDDAGLTSRQSRARSALHQRRPQAAHTSGLPLERKTRIYGEAMNRGTEVGRPA